VLNLNAVFGSLGYSTFNVSDDEVRAITNEIKAQYLSRVSQLYPDQVSLFEATPMNSYHTLSHLVDHVALWGDQEHRILPQKSLTKLQDLPLFRPFMESPDDFIIGDPQDLGYGELIWRIVRPRPWSDVGPLHADEWFWKTEIYPKSSPVDFARVKFWLAIVIEDGDPAFSFAPGSHLLALDFSTEERDGRLKPRLNFDPDEILQESLPGHLGHGIVFHDKLLHRGVSGNSFTRVSLEFTAYVSNAI